MKQHKHWREMALYAQDATETDKPWERWQLKSMNWTTCCQSPRWDSNREYRRKPQKKAVDLSVLIESRIDCEFSDTLNFGMGVIGGANSGTPESGGRI